MKKLIIDGNTAASLGAYALSEMAAIYPITPSSTMAENCSEWAEEGKLNIFGKPMKVIEMQSEAGAAGALHGMVSAGALATTFTASQGLLLMIPNMYKLAGELWPCVIHVSARTVATHALSIFGDHGDIYACRQTGFTMLCSSTVQQCYDHAVIAHLLALETSVPVLHFFDGFRTSHEINECEILSNEQIEKLVDKESLARFRARALDPKNPVCQGTTQNPDIFFQNREACNLYYGMVPAKLEEIYKRFEKLTGRRYSAVEAYGNPKAKTVSVAMGSATRTLKKVAEKEGHYAISLNCYRPFPTQEILDVLPKKFEKLIVFDRTKEPNAMGEPLYTEVNAILNNSGHKGEVVGVKYGLGGKDFKPSHAKAVFDNTRSGTRFTIGIEDDVTHLSIPADKSYAMGDGSVSAKFFGLGSDGTVSANKNTIKIIGEKTTNHVQAYFEYDSKKSGSITTSHLRFGPKPIDSPYLTTFASFIGCHNASFVHKIELIDNLRPGGIFVLNTCEKDMSAFLPDSLKQKLMKKEATFYTIDAFGLAQKLGLGNRINVVMQSVFFKLMELMPYEEAKQAMKDYATKTYGKKGEVVVLANHRAVDEAVEHLVKIDVNSLSLSAPKVEEEKSAYHKMFVQPISTLQGESLKVSAFSADGRVPTGTTEEEKRNIAEKLPRFIEKNCIHCNQCSVVCPHATIRPMMVEGKEKLQIFPEDCTGCSSCANVCPAREKALVMVPKAEIFAEEKANLKKATPCQMPEGALNIKTSQYLEPLFEFNGACAGCGETPYIKLLTQLFGKDLIIANATGCTSIYGGNAPTCPYSKNKDGHGPAWANSLFEDNAEFGLGIYLADKASGKNSKVWIIGGDGWAYDIGFGGLDHVLSSGENVKVLVLDTEVYSNTGGQASKATSLGATAKFADAGKKTTKKRLGEMMLTYGNVFVAEVAIGANMAHTLNVFKEAQEYDGPALIIAYATCINQGLDMSQGMKQMKRAFDAGYLNLYTYNPSAAKKFKLLGKEPDGTLKEFLKSEVRFKKASEETLAEAERTAQARYARLKKFEELL